MWWMVFAGLAFVTAVYGWWDQREVASHDRNPRTEWGRRRQFARALKEYEEQDAKAKRNEWTYIDKYYSKREQAVPTVSASDVARMSAAEYAAYRHAMRKSTAAHVADRYGTGSIFSKSETDTAVARERARNEHLRKETDEALRRARADLEREKKRYEERLALLQATDEDRAAWLWSELDKNGAKVDHRNSSYNYTPYELSTWED